MTLSHKLGKLFGAGLLGVLASCVAPESSQQNPTSVHNTLVSLTPKEKLTLSYQDSFSKSYELAKQAYETGLRSVSGTSVDKVVFEKSFLAYTVHVLEMKLYLQELKRLQTDVTPLEAMIKTFPPQ